MTLAPADSGLHQPTIVYGRERELASLRELLSSALLGRGALVLVGGEAGIGKTTLVDAFAGEARAAGALMLSGACYDLETTPPYGPWVELLRTYAPVDGLPPAPTLDDLGSGSGHGSGQDALFRRVRVFLSEVAAQRPVVLVLEDQHWADPASLELLRALARTLADSAVLLIVTYRDDELTARQPLYRVLPQLVREARAERLDLRRLDRAGMHRLVAGRYALPPADTVRLVEHLRRYAEGNPFYTFELLRALERDGLLRPIETGWLLEDLEGVRVPPLVRQVIDERVAWLGAEAREPLEVAAVIGAQAPLDLWCAAADLTDEQLAAVLEGALAARLVEELPGGEGVRFSHALVREALYNGIVLPRRRAWHRRIGELLAARPQADPEAVAHHLLHAGDRRAAAAEWLTLAGERAFRASAPQDAIEHFEQALRLLEGEPETEAARGWLLCGLAEAHRYSEPRLALSYLEQARQAIDALGDRALAAVVLWSRARIRGFLGESTLADLESAAAAFDALPPDDRARVLELGRRFAGSQGPLAQWLAHHGHYAGATRAGSASVDEHANPAGGGAFGELGHALLGLGLAYAGSGDPARAEGAFEKATQHFLGAGNDFMAAAALKWQLLELALPCRADDPPGRAQLVAGYEHAWLQSGRSSTGRDGRPLLPLFPEQVLAGDWVSAEEAAKAHVDTYFLRVDALAALGELELARGQYAAAWERVEQVFPNGPDTAPSTPFFVRALAMQRLAADLALAQDRPNEALPWIEAHERWLDWSGRVLDRAAGLLLRARYYAAIGDREAAVDYATQALARAEEPRQPLALLTAHRYLGELHTRAGRHDESARHLDAALALATACAAPYERALTLLAQAEGLRAAGRPSGISSLVSEARAILTPLNAAPAIARADALDSRAPGSRADAPTAPAGLSPREVEVLHLVARGLTDAEVGEQLFISPRTVARHLQSVYNKLGVSSRTAATAVAFEYGLVGPRGADE